MSDCLILGGGVIGLSLAYELAGQGMSVRIVDRAAPGREASWAGAGILPPGSSHPEASPLERLAGLAERLHPQWSARLLEETGIDNGYRRSGGIYLARSREAADELEDSLRWWQWHDIPVEPLTADEALRREPQLGADPPPLAACWLPGEAQIRNPRHLRALLAACTRRDVEIVAGAVVEEFLTEGEQVRGVRTTLGRFTCDTLCIAAGAWSGELTARLGVPLPVVPVRGQMLLFDCGAPLLTGVINEGPRYLVPRPDGRLLAGSTEELAGFDKRTTSEGIAGLIEFATSLVPRLRDVPLEKTWAGLRPGTPDGMPFLGLLPGWANAYVAAGHFRSGLTLSPATAVVLSQLIRGQQPSVELDSLGVLRVIDSDFKAQELGGWGRTK